ncbi:MAG TPA: hypothetical protein VGP17_04985 [Solirubrobacteraceae bacterium]|jgi:hypothetical protein|nr:hypothetical protein [Solirubrobacteraceae bacterium]
MRRLLILLVGVVFVGGFGFLTLTVVERAGFSIGGVGAAAVSLFVIALIVVGIVGALRDPH